MLSSNLLDSIILLMVIVMEKLVEIGMLFDFYGKLLSERQYLAIELYYLHDLTLSEIGQEMNISRQGVYDTLRRAENRLYEYEDTLGLVEKFSFNKDKIKTILKYSHAIEEIAKSINCDECINNAKRIQYIALEILENDQEGI